MIQKSLIEGYSLALYQVAAKHDDPGDIEKDLDDRHIGGMGIHLVRSLMDEMIYEFTQGRNILILKKNID